MFQSNDRWLAIAISMGALLIAGLHVARPQLSIDSVTLILIGLAVLPWLAPIIQKITLPGGTSIELREIQQKIDQVSSRVSAVERIVFSGAISENQVTKLEATLNRFDRYLAHLGFATPTPLPRVNVVADDYGASFDPDSREIMLGKGTSREDDFVCREYAHYILLAALGLSAIADTSFYQLESGVALYLTCSFLGRPRFGSPAIAEGWGLRSPYVATLENDLTLMDVPANDLATGGIGAGQVWGAVFWALRGRIQPAKVDRLVADSWMTLNSVEEDRRSAAFVADLIARIGKEGEVHFDESALRRDLRSRGLTTAAPAGASST